MSDAFSELVKWARDSAWFRAAGSGLVAISGLSLIGLDLALPKPILVDDYIQSGTYIATVVACVFIIGQIAWDLGRKSGLAAVTKAAIEKHERHQNRILSRVMNLEGDTKATLLWFLHQLTRESWVDGRDPCVVALVEREILVPVAGNFSNEVRPYEVPRWLWTYLEHVKKDMAQGVALRTPLAAPAAVAEWPARQANTPK
jgi:hypothetical protein